jgi:hypothetical protein
MANCDPTIASESANPSTLLDDLGIQLLELQSLAAVLDDRLTSTSIDDFDCDDLDQISGLASAQLRLTALAKSAHSTLEAALGAAEGGAR